MRVEINERDDLKKERKFEYSIYPENERDIEILRGIQTSIALANMNKHGKIEDKHNYPITFISNDIKEIERLISRPEKKEE